MVDFAQTHRLLLHWHTIRRTTANTTRLNTRGECSNNSRELVLGFARTITWNGKHPTTELVNAVYKKGVRLSVAEMNAVERNVDRDANLGKWFLDIDGRTRKLG